MKPNRITLIVALFVMAMASAFMPNAAKAAQDEPEGGSLGLARISYMTGDVLFNSEGDDDWAEAAPNYPLIDGDRLWVGDDSKLEVRFGTGETAWVNYESELDMLTLSRGDDGNAYQLGLPFGEASFDVKNFTVLGSVFQVDTPNSSIRAFGRALFRVSSLSDGTTQVGVATGSVEVETDRGVANIHEGEMLEVDPDGRPRITDLPGTDDWDDWVDARLDRYTRQYRSERYLPKEMDDYAYEFDTGGRWVSYPQYGNVWVPNVAPDWSPYSNGRWVWAGHDYVWLGYDPWYAPFHYGNWTWTVSFGWCWVPPVPTAVYWSPGYVGWVWDVDYVYWVPLAPGEIYYGYGYYGPRSVNIYKTTVIVNKNVYKNCDVRNGVVVVDRGGFLKGRTVRIKEKHVIRRFKEKIVRKEVIKERIVREDVTFGAPPARAIKPVRESRLPKPEKIFKADRLPKRVVERKVFEKERRVVRNKVKSAFQPAQKPRHMEKLERLQKPEFKREERREMREERRDERQNIREDRREDRQNLREDRRDERRDMREQRRDDRSDVREERRDERQDVRKERREERQDVREDRRDERQDVREDRREERVKAKESRNKKTRDDKDQMRTDKDSGRGGEGYDR